MADQAITALPKKTYSGSSKIAATDYLLGIDSAEGYQMLIQDLGEYIINKVTASLAGSNQTLAAAISALNSNMQSLTGGMAKRIAGSVASGGTMTIILDSAFSTNEGFALANLNIGGNAMAGCALLYLGRGTSKVGKIFGDMPANYYSASYGSGIWTITNNSESTMFITAIVSK